MGDISKGVANTYPSPPPKKDKFKSLEFFPWYELYTYFCLGLAMCANPSVTDPLLHNLLVRLLPSFWSYSFFDLIFSNCQAHGRNKIQDR